jgi:hypothetical protein
MRNFFRNPWGSNTNIECKKQIADILDTDEDRVINQYRKYLRYINDVKKGVMRKSESVMRHAKERYIKELHISYPQTS